MNETLFFVLGIGLVVAAVLVAGIGLRWERFPTSKAILAGATAAFAALVVATATFAWLNAEDEQEHREAELAEAAEENAAEGDEAEVAEEVGTRRRGGALGDGERRRRRGLRGVRLRRLSHARRRRLERDDRPRPRPGPRGRGRGVHRDLDRRSQRRGRERVLARDHARDLR